MTIDEPAADHERRSRILIPDTSPLSLLAMIGSDALDWLFVPNADVWVPDMVKAEATRAPDPGDDQRLEHRATISDWFKRNENRIHIVETHEGVEYAKAMETWILAGSKPELKPSWKGRGEKSILQVLDVVETLLADGEAAVVLIDDNKARIAIQLENEFDIDLMGTESFITWMHEKFKIADAQNAWAAIKIAAGGNAPVTNDADPIYLRK
ncbi:hypothetical protein [Bradyrhizobium mercantei]|uniref:hypothetical protein n=1 Tax=Bradyrhizobium mercantei TaxID=1904807 RepID=UPI000978BAA0|nr:hypothetical protein [Bradyrhizobium mercantei]